MSDHLHITFTPTQPGYTMNMIKANDKGIHRTFEYEGHLVSGYVALWGEEIAPNVILARNAAIQLPDGRIVYGPDHPKHKK